MFYFEKASRLIILKMADSEIRDDLRDLADNYIGLLGATRPNDAETDADKNYRWTSVVSTAHFAFAGCVENLLREDVADAWLDIDDLGRQSTEPWKFVWNAKDHELPDSVTDLEQFRL